MGFCSRAAITNEVDEERKTLRTLSLVLETAVMAAAELARRYPNRRLLAQSVIDLVSDDKSETAGALATLDERMSRYPDRGGAT